MIQSHLSSQNSLEVIDDVYTVAFWLTGNDATAGMLVSQSYLVPNATFNKETLFKALRDVYQNSFGSESHLNSIDISRIDDPEIAKAIIELPSDFKMVVLLADIAGLTHQEISNVIEKPIQTVRAWLQWGRKLLSTELQLTYTS